MSFRFKTHAKEQIASEEFIDAVAEFIDHCFLEGETSFQTTEIFMNEFESKLTEKGIEIDYECLMTLLFHTLIDLRNPHKKHSCGHTRKTIVEGIVLPFPKGEMPSMEDIKKMGLPPELMQAILDAIRKRMEEDDNAP